MAEWSTPTSHKQLQSFLGFASFCPCFIQDYSKLVAPLTKLTSTLRGFQWSHEAEVEFTHMRALFSSTPLLFHPDPSRQFVVEVDASATGVSVILFQQDPSDQKLHSCALYSHQFMPDEVTYDVGNRELLAVILACHNNL